MHDSLEKIRALCRDLAARQGLDDEARDELCGHMEDKLMGYLSGEVKITEEDALLLVRSHFGDAEKIARQVAGERKETVMSYWFWMAVIAAMLITVRIFTPEMQDPMEVWLGIMGGMAIQRIWQSDNAFSRELR